MPKELAWDKNMISPETKEFIKKHRFEDPVRLALNAKPVQHSGSVNVPFAIAQIAGRQSIEEKIPSWFAQDDIIYPGHLPLEQCSSEFTSKYKTSLLKGFSFADLTGGFGVDCYFISANFEQAYYVEQQEELCEIVRHNFVVLRRDSVRICNENTIDFLSEMPEVDCIFIDPARRESSGRKIIAIQDCSPDISLIRNQLLEKADIVLIKLSPMLDISRALQDLPETSKVHVVSVNNECKELLFQLNRDPVPEPEIICVNIDRKGNFIPFTFYKSEEKALVAGYASEISGYLYEPDSSILKAGAFKTVASRYGLKKIHSDSHLYISSGLNPDFLGRIFRIESCFSLGKPDLREQLRGLTQANIAIRNFPASVDELKKKLKLKDGGNVYLFATTLQNGKKVLIKGSKISTEYT